MTVDVAGRAVVRDRIVAGSVYLAVVVVIAAVAAWPIYRSAPFLLLVGASATAAATIAVLAARLQWRAGITALVLAAAVFILGVPLAVPSRLSSPIEFVGGLGEVATGLVVGWKDLVTVELPVGSYRNLLVPALVVFLVGTCIGLLISWRADRTAYVAVPIGLGMVSFGLFFGRTSVSAPLQWGPVALFAPLETALGVAGLLSSVLWLAWRSRDERVRSLHRAALSSGVRVSRHPTRADRRRLGLGAGMVAVAVIVVAGVVPLAANGIERTVLRSSIGPELDVSAAVSPLTEYRAFFDAAAAEQVLFTVDADGALPDRVRVATLDSYDGEIYRSGGTGSVDDARFVRVPSTRDAGEGRPLDVRITIDALDGIWMPTVGRLESVEFSGDRAAALADSFYYRDAAAAGVQTAGDGFETGDVYRLRGVEPATPELTAISAPGRIGDAVEAPASLRTWVRAHVAGSDGAALAALVDLLRARGYLSHALTDGERAAAWQAELPGYRFQSSAAGHSLARIDTMFTRLLEREADPQASASGNLVAAVGDDEQFAVAVALMAGELGFPARVVVGAVLSSADPAVRTCEDGSCRPADLSVWTEVQATDGTWVPIDVTPQFEQSPSLETAEQRDPLNVTEVRPDPVEEVVPPQPVQEDTAREDRPDDSGGWNLAWLWPALRIAGIALLVLALILGPFAVIAAAKLLRRRARRAQGDPAARIAGGWEEYVDAAVDAGGDPGRTSTRTELAGLYATPSGAALADIADRATFSNVAVTAADAESYWRTVDDERARIAATQGIWRRIAASVSLRSFTRRLAHPAARARLAERGKRRVAEPAR